MKKTIKVYVVIMLYPGCTYGDEYATCKVFEKASDAEEYIDKRKYENCYCHIEEREIE